MINIIIPMQFSAWGSSRGGALVLVLIYIPLFMYLTRRYPGVEKKKVRLKNHLHILVPAGLIMMLIFTAGAFYTVLYGTRAVDYATVAMLIFVGIVTWMVAAEIHNSK